MALTLCGVQGGPSLIPLLLAGGLKLMAVAQPSKYFRCFPADSSQLLSRWLLPVFGHWLGDALCRASWLFVRWAQLLGTLDAFFSPKFLVRARMAFAELTKLETLPTKSLGTSLWSTAGVMLRAYELLVISSLSSCPSCPDPWEHRAVG